MVMNESCAEEIPYARDFFESISVTEIVFITLAGILTLLNIGIFLENALFMRKSLEAFRTIFFKSIVILGLYPAVTVFAFFSICVPRAFLVSQLCTSVYIAVSVYNFLTLIFEYFGGRKAFISKVVGQPYIVCCCWRYSATGKNVTTDHFFIAQYAVIQLGTSFISLVLWTNGNYIIGETRSDNAAVYINVIRIVSTILCMNSTRRIVQISRGVGEHLSIRAKSDVLLIVLFLYNTQGFVFGILAANDIPTCTDDIPSGVRARTWSNLLIILEMFLLAVLARIFYHRPHTDFAYDIEENKENNSTHPENPTINHTDEGTDNLACNSLSRQAIDRKVSARSVDL